MIDWDGIDLVMLDMDGTLLDLHYDNTIWNELLAPRYQQVHQVSAELAADKLFGHMRDTHGTLAFYDIEYWNSFTQFDVMELHREASHLIDYRPGVADFLDTLRSHGKAAWLVSNAHPLSIEIKNAHTGLCDRLEKTISSYHFGAPKEDVTFWTNLAQQHPFNPTRTLFIDDNEPVLEAARQFGVGQLITISQPDSQRPARSDLRFPTLDHFNALTDALSGQLQRS